MKRRICLNMIVKNESKIIERCLSSVREIIDSWCIVDTGSTDGTQDIIKNFLHDIPGELIERPWVNFGFNRNEALELAKGRADWLLLIDADMVLSCEDFNVDTLDANVAGYHLLQKNSSLSYYNLRLLNNSFVWKCKGVTHESYVCEAEPRVIEKLHSLFFKDYGDGGSKGDKFARDIKLLKAGLESEPDNSRYMFYLAQTYRDVNALNDSIHWYKRRVDAGGWHEEVWYSMYMISSLNLRLDNLKEAEFWCKKAYQYHPKRSEAIYELCRHYRFLGMHKEAHEYYRLGKSIPYPKDDVLFVSHAVYSYLFDYEMTVLHYYLFPEDRETGLRRCIEYLRDDHPLSENVYSNLKFYLSKLIDHSTNTQTISVPNPAGFVNSSPCKFVLRDGREITNIRQVNYYIDKQHGSFHLRQENLQDSSILTQNYMLGVGQMKEIYHLPLYKSHIDGLEDVRLFERNGKVQFLATSKNLESDRKNRIAFGDYDVNNREIHVTKVFDSPLLSECEKNWVMLNEDVLIYSWSPLRFYDVENLSEVSVKATPQIFNHFKGSSAIGVKFMGLNWFVVHGVIYESPRTYMHYLVALNEEGAPIMHSLPFSFEGEKIEYCLSLNLIADKFEFHYSTWDETSKFLQIPINYFSSKMILCT